MTNTTKQEEEIKFPARILLDTTYHYKTYSHECGFRPYAEYIRADLVKRIQADTVHAMQLEAIRKTLSCVFSEIKYAANIEQAKDTMHDIDPEEILNSLDKS